MAVTPSGIASCLRSFAIVDLAFFGGAAAGVSSTGRKRSSAVLPTSANTRFWFSTPGSCTTIVSPWIAISGSATPIAFTRVSMIACVCSSASWLTFVAFLPALTGCRTTDTPPWRSRPSTGRISPTSVTMVAPIATTAIPTTWPMPFLRIVGNSSLRDGSDQRA